MDCKCKLVIETQGFIPDYSEGTSTDGRGILVPIKAWECICCGKKWGYLSTDQIVVDINKIRKEE